VKNANHSHPPCPQQVRVREVVHGMRERATNTTDSISKIYRECSATLAKNPSSAAILPTLYALDSGLYRQRHSRMPALPQTRADIQIPDIYRTTSTGETFLMANSSINNSIMIFCTTSNLKLLCGANVVCMDGTFDAVPHLYSQLFTLHSFEHGKLLPLVYCLMSSKERTAYVDIFQALKSQAEEINLTLAPTTIISDFESGLIPAVRDEFPNAHHQGCHFHYTQVRLLLLLH
jgi:MULE transposase domain